MAAVFGKPAMQTETTTKPAKPMLPGGQDRYAGLAATLAGLGGMKPPAGDPFANWFGGMKPPTGSVGFTDSVGGGMKPPASATTSDGTALWGVGSGAFSGMKPPAGATGFAAGPWGDSKPGAGMTMAQAFDSGVGAKPVNGFTMANGSDFGKQPMSAPGMEKGGLQTPPVNDALVPPPAAPQAGPVAPPGYHYSPTGQLLLGAGPATPPPPAAPGAPAAPGMTAGPQGWGTTGTYGDSLGVGEGLPGITTTGVDYSTLPGLDTDFSAMGDRVRNAMFQRTSGLLNPEHERARTATAQRLANQGIVEGSERWNEEMDRLDQQRALSLERAGLDADLASGDEMGRLFSQALAARQQLGGERERGADRTYSQSLGVRGQLAGERLQRAGIDANIAAANASAGAAAEGHRLRAAEAAAANDLARARLGMDLDEQGFSQWLRSGQFAREGVNLPNFGTPIPLDVTGAAGIAQQGANANAANDAARRSGMWSLAGTLLGGAFGKKGYQ